MLGGQMDTAYEKVEKMMRLDLFVGEFIGRSEGKTAANVCWGVGNQVSC